MATITIPDVLAEKLLVLAKEQGDSLADLVGEVLSCYLEGGKEDVEDVEDAQYALEAFRCNPDRAVSMDELLKEAGFSREALQ